MGGNTKLAQQRLSVIELAKALGNVSEACRRRHEPATVLRVQSALSDPWP